MSRSRWWTIAVLAMMGCSEPDVADLRLKLENVPPANWFLGGLEGFGGTPGRHYTLWGEMADETTVRISRFVILSTDEEQAFLDAVSTGDPQLRDYDDTRLLGYANSQCVAGPCNGSRMLSHEDLTTMVRALLTREDDGGDETSPSNDIVLRGPVLPYARGTLRGNLGDPSGAQLPRGELVVIPAIDDANL